MNELTILLGLVLIVSGMDMVLSQVAPKSLRGFAWVPAGVRKLFQVHPSHFRGDAPPARPPSYRHPAAERAPHVEVVAFPEEVATDNVRLIPLEGGMSAMLVSTKPLQGSEATARIDAIAGPGRDRFVLRAHITPSSLLFTVVVGGVLLFRLGFSKYGVFCTSFIVANVVRTFWASRRALAWAINTTEDRLTTPREGAAEDDADAKRDEAPRPVKLPKRRKKVFLDAEEGKETTVSVASSAREPVVGPPMVKAPKRKRKEEDGAAE